MGILFTYEVGKSFIPKNIQPGIRKFFLKAGLNRDPYSFFGLVFYICVALSILIYSIYILPGILEYPAYLTAILAFVSFVSLLLLFIAFASACIYYAVDLVIYHRTKKLEEILPSFFEVLSSNLKGGLPFDKALWLSIKPEFGILSHEIGIAAKKVMTGNDVEDALMEFADKYDSPMLKRSMDLIVSELNEGGSIAEIVDKVVENYQKTRELKEEMTASVLGYVIFISIVVMFIAPVLFALSKGLFEIIKDVVNVLAESLGSGDSPLGLDVNEIELDSRVFDNFARVSLGIIGLFSSFIVSIIEKGNIKGGIKYVPLYFFVSQIVYWIASTAAIGVFGGVGL